MKLQPNKPYDSDLGYYFDVKMNDEDHEDPADILWIRTPTHVISITTYEIDDTTAELKIGIKKILNVPHPSTVVDRIHSLTPTVTVASITSEIVTETTPPPGTSPFPEGL